MTDTFTQTSLGRLMIGGSIFLASVTLLGSSPAEAAVASAQPASIKVSYGDLDLAATAGRATFGARLRHAARLVCGVGAGIQPVSEARQARRCYAAALAQAEAEADTAIAIAMLLPRNAGKRAA